MPLSQDHSYMRVKRYRRHLAASICVALACTIAASVADMVHDNGGPEDTLFPGGYEMTQWVEADDFAFADTVRVDAIKFWDLEIAGRFAGSVYWRIYASSADGGPGDVVAGGLVAPLHERGREVAPPYEEWVNSFSIDPITLPPGTYWLGLHNGPYPNNSIQFVFWETSARSGGRSAEQNTGPNFEDDEWDSVAVPGRPTELAFQIQGIFAPRASGFGRDNGVARFSFTTRPGYTYRVEYKNALSDEWAPLPGREMVAGNGNVVEVTDPDPSAASLRRRFYRAVVL